MTTNGKSTGEAQRKSYPYYSIEKCVEFVEILKKAVGFNEIPVVMAAQKIGLTYGSGSSDRALSDLQGYGLIESRGVNESKVIRLTQLAKRIVLRDPEDGERKNAIKEAVLNDETMVKAIHKWKDHVPSKEDLIRILQLDDTEWGYTERAAKRFAAVIFETLEYVDFAEKGISDEDIIESETPAYAETKGTFMNQPTVQSIPIQTNRSDNLHTLTLEKGEVKVFTTGNITHEDYEFMLLWLERLRKKIVESPAPNAQEKKQDE